MFRWLRRLFRRSRRSERPPDRNVERDLNGLNEPDERKNADDRVPVAPSTEQPSTEQPAEQPAESQPVKKTSAEKSALDDLKPVLNVLRAYVVTFGQPESEVELRAVIGAIVANLSTVTVENARLERFTDEAIAAFESLGLDPTLVDVSAQLLAEQVAVWRREQETTVTNVISAYLQQFAPDNVDWKTGAILNLTQTVVATLNDGSLSRSGGRVLVDRVVETFSLEQALGRWVAPEWVALAQRVANYAEKGDLQAELRSIAWAYVQQFQAILSPQLIEQIMAEGSVTVSPAEFFSGNLTDFSQMLYYKFQLLQADPVVQKSHQEIAADVHQAIARHQAGQQPGLDVTKGIKTGELEISSPFKQTS